MSERNNKMELLGSAPIPKALMALGVPIMIGMLINALYNLVDAYSVGGLGESPMGAISIVFPLGQVVLPLEQIFPLQLGHSSKDSQDKASAGGGGIQRFLLGNELHTLGGQLLYQLQQILGASGKSGDAFHHHGIPLSDELQKSLQFRAAGILAALTVNEYPVYSQFLHQHFLTGGVLAHSANPHIPHLHG